jgi:hypothetical protein
MPWAFKITGELPVLKKEVILPISRLQENYLFITPSTHPFIPAGSDGFPSFYRLDRDERRQF